MHELKELYAWVVTDPDGDEGVLRRQVTEGTQPLIADSIERAGLLERDARRAAAELNLPVRLVKFIRERNS